MRSSPDPAPTSHEVEIAVRYDGPDLDDVAHHTGLTPAEVVAAHTGTPWRVAFGGFAPGFAYLVGGDPRLRVPRRDRPRASVPAGAVGLAGEFSGVYPRTSPGGWQLVGTTEAVLWDADRHPPALLGPGATVRFVDVEGAAVSPTLEVLATGPLVLVEDAGRPGLAAVGVGRSGAADRGVLPARGQAGREPPQARVPRGAARRPQRACPRPGHRGAHRRPRAGQPSTAAPVAHATLVELADGAVLTLGMPSRGLRTYLTVRGGIDVPPVLGSRSHDTLSGLGPAPVAVGDLLPVGAPGRRFPTVDHAPQPVVRPDGPTRLHVGPGPRSAWVGGWDSGLGGLLGPDRVVAADSDRVGLRLTGSPVQRVAAWRDAELPSEGMVRGAVQLPPDGEPVVFLADHPVTGGYPVIGVLTASACDLAAQLRPGDAVRLTRAALLS